MRLRLLVSVAISMLAVSPSVAAAATPDAVVLVSGITTTTPFTTPSSVCTGTFPRGETWSYDGSRLASAAYRVYTAPVNYGPGPVGNQPPTFSGCPAQLPASMTINSRGDIYANAQALASFVGYLRATYGVRTVRIVAHSYGGLWTRGALRLASASFPGVQVQSITTLGTPHLGSYLADIAEGIDPDLCGHDVLCMAIAKALIAVREKDFEPALSQVTAASVAQWNAGQGTSLSGIPLTSISGNAVSLPGITNPYVSPDDPLVGLSSAQAAGLESSGVIPELSCFAPLPDVHSNTFLPFFPKVKYSLVSDPTAVGEVEQTLSGNPPRTLCPSADVPVPTTLIGVAGHRLTVGLRVAAPLVGTRLPRAAAGDAIVVRRGTRVVCGGHSLSSVPLLTSGSLRVIPPPSCDKMLRFIPRRAARLYLRHSPWLVAVRVAGRRIFLRVEGPVRRQPLVVAIKRGHRFVPQRLNGQGSLRIGGRARTATLRIELRQGGGRLAVGVVTVHL